MLSVVIRALIPLHTRPAEKVRRDEKLQDLSMVMINLG